MPVDAKTAIAQIDQIIARARNADSSLEGRTEALALCAAAIARLAPPGSEYIAQMRKVKETPVLSSSQAGTNEVRAMMLCGILGAMKSDYEDGRMQTFQELLHADLFSDFLEMAEYFLDEGYKDPAAVMAGGVLEEHLRKLCTKHGVTIPAKPKLDTMNADLAKAGAYGKNEQKQVTAWAGVRNDAAHGNYGNYTIEQVKLMVAGIRDFLARFPA